MPLSRERDPFAARGTPEAGAAPVANPEPSTAEPPGGWQFDADGRVILPGHRPYLDARFVSALHRCESADAGYRSVNASGALGRYQLTRTGGLRSAGMADGRGNWTGKYGVHGAAEFLANPAAQELALEDYMRAIEGYNRAAGNDRFVGTAVAGKAGPFVVTEGGLAAAAHRVGQRCVRQLLDVLRANGWRHPDDLSAFDPDTRDRLLAVETRLRTFAAVPYRPAG